MNPRYLAYCRAHGRSADEMLAYDKEQWPGGCMCGFILWMGEQWDEFEKQHLGEARRAAYKDRAMCLDRAMWRNENMDAFDQRLQSGF